LRGAFALRGAGRLAAGRLAAAFFTAGLLADLRADAFFAPPRADFLALRPAAFRAPPLRADPLRADGRLLPVFLAERFLAAIVKGS
jgi:hypothetical protein